MKKKKLTSDWASIQADWARDADAAHQDASDHFAIENEQLHRYADKLHAKQPKELIKVARKVRADDRRTHWETVKKFMRELIITRGLSTEKILDEAELKFPDDDRSALARKGLSGLRKEMRQTKEANTGKSS